MPNTRIGSLAQAAGRLPPVDQYFVGWRHGGRLGATVPDNLLLFSRTDAEGLHSGRKARDFHYRHVLAVALQGRACVDIDGRGSWLHPGEAMLIRPFELHDYHDISRGRLCWLFATFEQSEDRPAWPGRSRRVSREVVFLLRQLVLWRLQYGKQAPPQIMRASALSLGLVLELLDASKTGRERAPAERPATHWEQKLTEIVRQRGSHTGSVKQLAEQMEVSPGHLRALFRDRFGLSLGRYLHDQQLNRAIALLRDQTQRVGTVAELCGYSSIYSFSRAFRRATGQSPTRFRRATLVAP